MFELLATGIIISISIIGLGIYSIRKIKQIIDIKVLKDEIPTLVEPIYERTKADVQKYIEVNLPAISAMFASHLRENLQKSLGGLMSGQSRLDSGLAREISADLMNSSPLGSIIGPLAKKYLNMKPEAIAGLLQNPQIMSMAQKFLSNKAESTEGLSTLPPK